MLGQLAKIGTGAFDLLLNVEDCKRAMPVPVNARFDSMMPSYLENSRMYGSDSQLATAMTPWMGNATPYYQTDLTANSSQSSSWSQQYGSQTPGAAFSPSAHTEANGFSPAWSSSRGGSSPAHLGGTSPMSSYSTSPVYSMNSPSYSTGTTKASSQSSRSPSYSPGNSSGYSPTSPAYSNR